MTASVKLYLIAVLRVLQICSINSLLISFSLRTKMECSSKWQKCFRLSSCSSAAKCASSNLNEKIESTPLYNLSVFSASCTNGEILNHFLSRRKKTHGAQERARHTKITAAIRASGPKFYENFTHSCTRMIPMYHPVIIVLKSKIYYALFASS